MKTYFKFGVFALSAVVLLSTSFSKNEVLDKTQPLLMNNALQPTGPAVFQLRHLSRTFSEPAQCKKTGESCTKDSDCCNQSCDTFAGGTQKCL
jgi:hypothetical protein